MVTLILLFIFVTPRFVDFRDQPAEYLEHQNRLTVVSDGSGGSIWQADAEQVDAQDEGMVRQNFERLLRPVAGTVKIGRIEPVRDAIGHVVAYRAWVRK